jgi:branched-chain amino acid transport system permease protein
MEYLTHLATIFAIYAILALSLNLVVGYTGLLSLAHAGFFGLGAYVTAILTAQYRMNFFLSALIGLFMVMLLSTLIGLVFSKFKDDYYALATLGFNAIVFSVMLNWQSLTRGPLGIPGIPRPELFGWAFSDNFNFLLLTTCYLLLVFIICRYITQSAFGRVLKAIREDEQTIAIFGYNPSHYKLAIFTFSAGMAGIAGALFATYITFIDPSTFTIHESVLILSMIILGGLANLKGSVFGALFLILLPELLRFLGLPNDIAAQARFGLYGLLLIILMMYKPQGLLGEYKL